MAPLRSSVLVDRSADAVWQVIRDVPNISRWFPGMLSSGGDMKQRTVVLTDGSTLIEEIVTLDGGLRRMQYRTVGGDLPIRNHLGTVDVFEIDDDRALVAYSTEIVFRRKQLIHRDVGRRPFGCTCEVVPLAALEKCHVRLPFIGLWRGRVPAVGQGFRGQLRWCRGGGSAWRVSCRGTSRAALRRPGSRR
ncbi:SRPBCC family protein [Gordonia sp. DT30]|uniref:SRPBCC family protein n=1 Tax=unclassified Gordonia (in: high G+C Gram-positive bacteria) TaxID=2657482 RepID=UPI003CE8E518